MPINIIPLDNTEYLSQIYYQVNTAQRIIVLTGAGISTYCGIPDFRSPSGFFSNQNRIISSRNNRDLLNISVLHNRLERPYFLRFIASIYQSIILEDKIPGPVHNFIAHLQSSGQLQRCYTQNFDGLERKVGLRLFPTYQANSLYTKDNTTQQDEVTVTQADVIQLHGDLETVYCPVCQGSFPWDKDCTIAFNEGEDLSCQRCQTRSEEREKQGRRALLVGSLRPGIVLYGEEHPASEDIIRRVDHDLSAKPDLLLIFGTELRVHGVQKIVRDLAKAVHQTLTGRVIIVNKTQIGLGSWNGVIDDYLNISCEDFITGVQATQNYKPRRTLLERLERSLNSSPDISTVVEHMDLNQLDSRCENEITRQCQRQRLATILDEISFYEQINNI